ncbi:MAG: hypothetical protein IPG38_18900 [Chitinophagaceae bacterium]|nr:hypothetical protein [Chitinophagaceae bacterium]
MNNRHFAKAGILALVLVIGTLLCWELYVRSRGFDTAFDDNPALWSDKRKMVYETADRSTVFIGSSRIKFDLDIPTWEQITGDHAIQLACVGSSPVPILEDLANDKRFSGKLVIDVTEGLFFSTGPPFVETPLKNLKYYKEWTPAQKASFVLNKPLENNLVFLNKEWLSLNAHLSNLRIPNRQGVFEFPLFPPGFGRVKYNRQEYMTESFVADTVEQNKVKGIWMFFSRLSKEPPVSGSKLDSIFAHVKSCTDKIKARGGQILFVRTPSSGPFLMGESKVFPREKYWNRLLAGTNSPGIHFADYPAIANFQCPEFSHLSQPDAVIFTKHFINIMHAEMGWKFSKTIQPVP